MNMPQLVLLVLGGAGQIPGSPAPDTKAEAEAAGVAAKQLAGECDFRLDKGSNVKLRLAPGPALRWTNHLNRRFYGEVYLWTYEGRPEVVASINTIYAQTKQGTEAEFQSLSAGRPVLSHQGKLAWEPRVAGLEFRPLIAAPLPSSTATARLPQMRGLAGQFSVSATYGNKQDEHEELRLLRSPLYRYESPSQDVLDGAVFAFTKGTDPDALLIIEARKKMDEPQWHFAFARLNGYCALRAMQKDEKVWQVEQQSNMVNTDPTQPYFLFRK